MGRRTSTTVAGRVTACSRCRRPSRRWPHIHHRHMERGMTNHNETTLTKLLVAPAARLSAIRPTIVMPLVIGGLLALPGLGAAQCWGCDDSWFDGNSDMCVGMESGREGCGTVGMLHDHHCWPQGGDCEDDLFAASAQQAIEMIRADEMLPPSGGYFFIAVGNDRVVMRKCDRAVVARIPHPLLSNTPGTDIDRVADLPERLSVEARRLDHTESARVHHRSTDKG